MTASTKEKERDSVLKNAINLYRLYEDYICNILLLIHGFILSNLFDNLNRK
jgi:hypothetical protein